jgi:hypothetical protein
MAEVRWVTSGASALALDDRTFPVVFATWIGAPDTTLIRAFFAWNDAVLARVAQEHTVFVLISDGTAAARPDAAGRLLIADLTREMAKSHSAVEPLRAASLVVLDNPLVRGAMTAIGWLMGGMHNDYAASCAAAITFARERFEARGANWPAGLTPESYVPLRAPPART